MATIKHTPFHLPAYAIVVVTNLRILYVHINRLLFSHVLTAFLHRYLELPPSLAKIRHEHLCREASKPIAGILRNGGFAVVRQLLPLSKLQHVLGEAGADKGVILGAVALARELKALSSAGSEGYGYPPSSSPTPSCMHRSPTGTSDGLRKRRKPPDVESTGDGGVCVIHKDVEKFNPSLEGKVGSSTPRKKKGPTRISLGELGLSGAGAKEVESDGRWDPRRYTSRPEEWFRPLDTMVKKRWDNKAKVHGPYYKAL